MYKMDEIRIDEPRKELEVFSIKDKRKEYKIGWLAHRQRMSPETITTQAHL
jgi:hypothetical protein